MWGEATSAHVVRDDVRMCTPGSIQPLLHLRGHLRRKVHQRTWGRQGKFLPWGSLRTRLMPSVVIISSRSPSTMSAGTVWTCASSCVEAPHTRLSSVGADDDSTGRHRRALRPSLALKRKLSWERRFASSYGTAHQGPASMGLSCTAKAQSPASTSAALGDAVLWLGSTGPPLFGASPSPRRGPRTPAPPQREARRAWS